MPSTSGRNKLRAARGWPGRLVTWFAEHRRELPWRRNASPYRVWVSEVMLQQTRVETVVPYFERFIDRFPTVEALATAEMHDVLKLWEGLGYYSRARNLHRAAREVVSDHGGELPRTAVALQRLPGFGPYTAAAVASLAFGQPEPAVDGNVLRVGARFFGIDADISKARTRTDLANRLRPAVAASGDPAAFNQGLMELGGSVCKVREPTCGTCPLRRECVARREGLTDRLPTKARAKPRPHKKIAVGVCWRRGKILVGRRREDAMLGGLWEFPGGHIEPNESPTAAAVREVWEETGLRVTPHETYAVVDHGYSHFRVTITAIRCTVDAGRARAKSAEELRWVTPAELDELPFPTANRRIVTAIRAAHGDRPAAR